MKNTLFVILCVFIMSCNQVSKNLEFVDVYFTEKEELHAKSINVQTNLYRPAGLFIYNNKLIVCDYTDYKDLFKVFSMPEIKFLYSFGNIGQGPDEFVRINKSDINVSKYFEIMSRNKLSYFEINDSAAVRIGKQPLVMTKVYPINDFKKINDSLYILENEDYSDKYKFEFRSFNLINKKESTLGEVIYFDERLKKERPADIYPKLIKQVIYNEKHKKIAVFYNYYPVFKILSDNGDLLHIFSLKKDLNTISFETMGGNIVFFAEPYSTDKYIFVMWINKTKRDVMTDIDNFKPELLVFDWNGNLVKRFGLDKPISSFAVSNDCEKLYTASIREDDINTLYEYDISSVKEVKPTTSTSGYRTIENKFYTMEAPEMAKFVTDTEINQTIQYNNCLVNANYISLGKDGKELGAALLIYYIEGHENTSLQSDSLLFRHSGEDKKTEMIEIGGKPVFHISYTVHSKTYEGTPSILYENIFFFKQDGKQMDLSVITTTPNFDKYFADFSHIISSFTLKNK